MKNNFKKEREQMVRSQLAARGIKDVKVLDAMKKVPRHMFVPDSMLSHSYSDEPLPIGENQTISQPFIVAYMTEVLELQGGEHVLEIGTGSGYQAAILAEIVKEVYTIEILKPLAESADKLLNKLGYTNVYVKHGDGYKGWKEHAPYDAIIVTAAPEKIPDKLVEQLKVGGRMIIPVGSFFQELVEIKKTKDGIKEESLLPVRFVPMVHEER